MPTRTTQLIAFTAVACGGLLLFTGLASSDGTNGPLFRPKDGEIVAIYAKHVGKYLEVSPHDGRVRASAEKPTEKTALFRVMLLTTPMVDILVDAARTANAAEWSKRRHWTGPRILENGTANANDKGCQCSGFSNDHGFGAYCFGWEYESQTPWCYVYDGCVSQETRGSFGRKYAECSSIDEMALTTSETDYHDTNGEADWLDARYNSDEADWDARAWENVTSDWDETANFTGMDEYWAGMRQFDEGEEEVSVCAAKPNSL